MLPVRGSLALSMPGRSDPCTCNSCMRCSELFDRLYAACPFSNSELGSLCAPLGCAESNLDGRWLLWS